MTTRNLGFSLVEIAVVLVIIGLLLGGILKGQEMVNSARVRNMADMRAGISAAYFGFLDRFRRIPGDWGALEATAALGVTVNGGGDDNGRIDNPSSAPFVEPNAVWEQLSKAGFLEGAYDGAPGEPTTNNNRTPLNAFNHNVVLGRTPDYVSKAGSPVRLTLVMGRGIPVNLLRELDVKIDDGVPDTGGLRVAVEAGEGAVFGLIGESLPDCHENGEFKVSSDVQDCNAVYLY
ncbi:MAG: prepilin-type N-terminal cleavage/methylation domain-containing protein [Gammaproteobacteria bacterium]